ncbi:NADH-quinone oxidoreductase subunit C [Leeia sp. TBRC 13508]|uniref:NADH-quinone oxidoreductase subunit C n=1 Tax=Leeia speluncae TaxID=2884804 RepID=A0ABS8D2R2_9NEIS|nr:NADH-quinone oxidoreductase subunit C [Leeia speluncae]MCB6182276.1 NADH-quinone oxidoreductase subunit C [Leeia speluncae]
MAQNNTRLIQSLKSVLGDFLISDSVQADQLTIVVKASALKAAMTGLRDHQDLQFDQCIDVCGVDYSAYADGAWDGKRFAVVYHLLSVKLNQRLRVRVFCEDDNLPAVDSVLDVWTSVSWFEREAFDLYGIVFVGHPDLRRILTDYGFVGHPFRKDFPVSGNVEMRYDEVAKRVVYQAVTIEPRENTPRIVREEGYGG